MMRVSPETRERVLKVAAEDFGGATVDEAVRRLLDIYWETKAVSAMREFRLEDPVGWHEYLAEADEWDGADLAPTEPWDERA